METRRTRERTSWRALAPAGLVLAAVVSGCGGGTSYKNHLRPPAPLNITASVSDTVLRDLNGYVLMFLQE